MWLPMASAGICAACGPILAIWSSRAISGRPLFTIGWWRTTGVDWLHAIWFSVAAGSLAFCLTFRWSETSAFPAFCWFAMTAVVLGVVDSECQRLPRSIVAAMSVGGMLFLSVAALLDSRLDDLIRALASSVIVFATYLLIALVANGDLGFGDVTLFGAVSLYLGWAGWHAVFAALIITTVLGGLVSGLLLCLRKYRRMDRFAYGPMIIAGASIALMLP